MSCPNCKGRCGVPLPLSDLERRLLDELAQNAFLPVARFVLRSRTDPELSFVMTAPVCLLAEELPLRELGSALLSLQRRHYITLDYGLALQGFDYRRWERSAPYRQFARLAATPEAEPWLEPGSAALTLQGQEAIDELGPQ